MCVRVCVCVSDWGGGRSTYNLILPSFLPFDSERERLKKNLKKKKSFGFVQVNAHGGEGEGGGGGKSFSVFRVSRNVLVTTFLRTLFIHTTFYYAIKTLFRKLFMFTGVSKSVYL